MAHERAQGQLSPQQCSDLAIRELTCLCARSSAACPTTPVHTPRSFSFWSSSSSKRAWICWFCFARCSITALTLTGLPSGDVLPGEPGESEWCDSRPIRSTALCDAGSGLQSEYNIVERSQNYLLIMLWTRLEIYEQ